MKVYLAGTITGIDNYFEKFAKAADILRLQRHEVFNPAAANLEGMSLEQILAYELTWLCIQADAVAFLPGWEKSLGSRAEHATAVALGKKLIYL